MANNTALVTRFNELLDRQDWPATLELVAPGVRVQVGGQHVDRDGWQAFARMFYAAFPDARHTVQRTIDAGEYVVVLASFGGTHTGEFMGFPPSGRKVSVDLIQVHRVVDGRIVEHFGQFDSAGLMQQLAASAPDVVAVAKRWYERVDANILEDILALTTPDVAFVMGGQQLDREGYRAMHTTFYSAFPDGRHDNDEIVAVGPNRVLVKGTFRGTHKQPFHGMPATGKTVAVGYISVATVTAEGKVQKIEAQLDAAGLMQQLAS